MGGIDLSQYIREGFSYAIVVYLLWERREAINAVKDAINKLNDSILELTTLVRDRLDTKKP